MQTFLPYPSFKKSAEVLDTKRLYKQIVECKQILNVIRRKSAGEQKIGYANHPIVIMWELFPLALRQYQIECINEWLKRRYGLQMALFDDLEYPELDENPPDTPFWLGNERFHASHRSNLLRKFPEHYSQFGWKEPNDIPYYWFKDRKYPSEVENEDKEKWRESRDDIRRDSDERLTD